MADPGRVVVGVDGSEGARRALAWALAEARLRGAELAVVHTWLYPYVGASAFVQLDPSVLRRAAEDLLDTVVADVVGDDPGVPVTKHLVEGSPAAALVDAAKGADLLVVGSRGRGGFSGLLLGSVSQQVAHHARCPVVIVPSRED